MDKPSPFQRLDNPAHRINVLEVVGNGIVGGMERCVERLIDHLGQGDQFRFTVLCPFEGDFTDRVRAAGADVVIAPMPEDPPWHAIQMTTGLVRHKRIELLHAHLPNAHQLAGLVGRLTGVPVMSTIHGRQIIMPDLEVHRMVGSHLSVVCQHSYYHALGLGIDPDKLSCEPNGVDTQAFRPGPRPTNGLRERFGLPADTLLVGFVGRLSPEKAPEVFVRAASLLHERLPDVHFVVVGEGPMRVQLLEAVDRQGLQGHLHFAGRIDDVVPVYHDLDLQVCSSNSEAMPLALMEGMASGVPVIATRVGGVPEIVEHGRSGWLVAPRDYEDIAGRMFQMLTQPDLRQRIALRARASMEEHHQLSTSLDSLALRMRQLARPAGAEPRRIGSAPRAVASRGQAVAQALHQPVQAAGTAASVLADPVIAPAGPVLGAGAAAVAGVSGVGGGGAGGMSAVEPSLAAASASAMPALPMAGSLPRQKR